MSLEQALADNTAALKALTAALAGSSVATKAPSPAPVASPTPTAEGSKYFFLKKNDTVFERKPGDPAQAIEGAVEISEADFKKHQERLAKKYAHLTASKANAPSAPASSPASAAKATAAASGSEDATASDFDPFADGDEEAAADEIAPVDEDTLTEKMKELAKAAGGREKLLGLIQGHKGVPAFLKTLASDADRGRVFADVVKLMA